MENFNNQASVLLKGTRVCNCKYSKCLKLYCECFAAGEYCIDCNCNNCCNKPEEEDLRLKKIKAILERDPQAFRPKIPVDPETFKSKAAPHFKGCNCKRTKCVKKYCECYNAGIPCGINCKCSHCKNTTDNYSKQPPYIPPLNEYVKFLAEPLIKKKDSEEDMKSDEGSTFSEEIAMKSQEWISFEKFEDSFYGRLIYLLNKLS
ncbi:hypothetical protein SteCoe_11961 [Stentor coeruleus]|uniref:CRC domain-containing protein n=1 Tax=Stentor coeruleus TaxID=5963 RepID=A0A1R2CC11_9CILI|nr:hypothetical protein SteCoe_11961 [Stentor coeruleus]